jgi:hypothetical protein
MEMTNNIVAEGRKELLRLRVKDSILNAIGWCLEKIKAPAKLKEFEFVDPASDETVYLYTSKRYSVLCVGERRFYFDRVNGKFDGMSAPASLVTGRLEFGD